MDNIIISGIKYTIEELRKKGIFITDNGMNNNIIFHDFPRIIPGRGKLEIFFSGNDNIVELHEVIIFSGSVTMRFLSPMNATTDNNKICVGNNTYFNGRVEFLAIESNKKILVGQDCLFAHNVRMMTSDSHSIYDVNTNEKINPGGDIIIGNHVWISQHVDFLKKSGVADNSVVGIHSLVTKRFTESNICITGIPARVTRKGINWDKSCKWPL